MKKLVLMIVLLLSEIFPQIQTTMYLRGDMNAWGADAMSYRSLGVHNWIITRQFTGTTGTQGFKFSNTTPGWTNSWGRGDVVTPATNTLWYDNGGNSLLTHTNGKYYTYTWKDMAGGSNSEGFVLETSSAPISVTIVTDNNVGPGIDVTVSITTDGTPSVEQNIFVRYTTDTWGTWHIVQATGSGTSWTATIPASGNTGVTPDNQYYVFTTTVSLTTVQGFSGSNIDLSTINYNNNGGSNFPLPVELTSFSASIKNKSVNLVWHTATEVNNYGFEIEKTSPRPSPYQGEGGEAGSGWVKVGFVKGSGNSNSANEYSYTDKTVATGKYIYRLKQIDNDGKYEYSKEVEVDLGKPTTFALNQNYPNPFNPTTSIEYSVVGSQYVSLKVFNVLGKEVAVLVNEKQEPGVYTVNFSSANLSGGVYLYRLQAGDFVQTKKMILLK